MSFMFWFALSQVVYAADTNDTSDTGEPNTGTDPTTSPSTPTDTGDTGPYIPGLTAGAIAKEKGGSPCSTYNSSSWLALMGVVVLYGRKRSFS